MAKNTEKRLKSESTKRSKSGQKKQENPEQKKKVQAQLEEESSEEEETKVTRVGYLTMRQSKKDWKPVYVLLIGGSFYVYKNSCDSDYKLWFDLSGHQIVSPVEQKKGKKKYTFSLVKDNQPVFLANCANETELNNWVVCLRDAVQKERSEPPITRLIKKKRRSY